ncbi:MAG TPA: SpoIID/LytB domain-containing protein [Spirochaetota bacterium]|nr:SpoIID/LytB domain-containing protein [Spirochaetota bacterium]
MIRRGIIIPALATGILMSVVSCSPFMLRQYFPGTKDTTTVRVLILKTGNRFTVSSGADIVISGANTDIKRSFHGSTAEFTPASISKRIVVKSANRPLCLNGKPYRGIFELHNKNGIAFIINIIKIDEYLLGVVPCEIPSGWDMEALKAQAVAARTYAYYHLMTKAKKGTLYDLDATTNSQVYRGISDEKDRTTEAVVATSGEIISYNSMPILSYFHSTCGGKTIDDKYVWPRNNLKYLKGISCGFCEESTKYKWKSKLSLEEIHDCLSKKNANVGKIKNIRFKRKNDRVTDVVVRHTGGIITISGNNFRLLFPPEKMRSLYFTSKKIDRSIVLDGHGWGHGVGMCQWGARGMALRGYKYRDIITHYYSGVKISDIRTISLVHKMKD